MVYQEKIVMVNGRKVLFRSAREEDAQALIEYLRVTAAQTSYLLREPEEITITPEQETLFIRRNVKQERELLLLGFVGGVHVGNCSVSGIGECRRYSHRCEIAIALYQEYCGMGIGKAMMREALSCAETMGYEQAELEVMAKNKPAIALYKKLGFQIYGTLPRNMKYKDGSYDDAYWMMKRL